MPKKMTNIVELNPYWAIGSDKYNIILWHKVKPKKLGKDFKWEVAGFYPDLHNVLIALVNQEVRDTTLKSLKELTVKLDQIYGLIKNMPQIMVDDLRRG